MKENKANYSSAVRSTDENYRFYNVSKSMKRFLFHFPLENPLGVHNWLGNRLLRYCFSFL